MEGYYHVSSSVATYALGGITIFSGIFGTACGSIFLNLMMRKYEALKLQDAIKTETLELYRVEKACTIMPLGLLVGMILCLSGVFFSAFFSKPLNYTIFLVGVGLGEFCLFATISPTAMAIMTCVPQRLRGLANAVSIFTMHALGDFPSPFLIGV